MQEISECRVADIKQIEGATVLAVSNMFIKNQLTHVPVVEAGEAGEQRLRGLLSAAKVKRLLSRPEPPRAANPQCRATPAGSRMPPNASACTNPVDR